MSEDGVADVKPRTKETLLGIQTLLESKRGLKAVVAFSMAPAQELLAEMAILV